LVGSCLLYITRLFRVSIIPFSITTLFSFFNRAFFLLNVILVVIITEYGDTKARQKQEKKFKDDKQEKLKQEKQE
jgi:hypothetical protein